MTTENRVSFKVTSNVLENLFEAVENIQSSMPGLVTLKPGEKKNLAVPGEKSMAFTAKALEYAKRHPKVTPGYIDVGEWQVDTDAVSNLMSLRRVMSELMERMDDTIALSGSEAYRTALQFYQASKMAAKGGVPGAKTMAADLEARFPQGKSTKAAGNASENEAGDSVSGVSVIIEDGKIVGGSLSGSDSGGDPATSASDDSDGDTTATTAGKVAA